MESCRNRTADDDQDALDAFHQLYKVHDDGVEIVGPLRHATITLLTLADGSPCRFEGVALSSSNALPTGSAYAGNSEQGLRCPLDSSSFALLPKSFCTVWNQRAQRRIG